MCYGWGWSCWKDLSPYLLHQQHLSNCGNFLLLSLLWSYISSFFLFCIDFVGYKASGFAFWVLIFLFYRIMFLLFLIISAPMLWLMGRLSIQVSGILLVFSSASPYSLLLVQCGELKCQFVLQFSQLFPNFEIGFPECCEFVVY